MTTFAPFTKGLTSKRTALGAAAVVLMMGLAGCNSPAPSPSSSGSSASSSSSATTASTTPTAAPTATAVYKPATAKGKAQNVPLPVLPAVGKTNTKEGAEAFVKYWFALLSYANETGDTTRLTKLSASTCQLCKLQIDGLDYFFGQGRWKAGGQISTKRVEAIGALTPQQNVTLQAIQEPGQYYLADGSAERAAEGRTNTGLGATVTFLNGAWQMTDLRGLA
ncbi:DUF6318 family protein [Pseudarthrobacter sp. J1738]|uniref:DUF6318 family protein n=1 Tax=Pseudarthrobacter sp. J1738 TaxID=3420446 RepID=UPI003D299467